VVNFNTINRFSGYGQWSKRKDKIAVKYGTMREYEYKGGYRVSGSAQTTFSPRAQFAIKPDWEKDMVFRVSGGLYHQPPPRA
jgi:hypothetical protein